MTSQQCQMSLFGDSEISTLSVEDFRARLLALQGKDEVLKILEELCFLRLHGSHLLSDLGIYSLRTLSDSSLTMGGATFATILGAMDELGYNVEWQVFNSKNFGVPQNRERVFIVGHLRGTGTKPIFPFGSSVSEHNSEPKINILGNTKNPDGTGFGTRSLVYDSNGVVGALTATDYKGAKQVAIHLDNEIKVAGKLPMSHDQNSRVYDPNGLAPTLSTMQGGGQEPKIRVKEATARGRAGKKLANTLLTGETQAVVAPGFKIRKLTPRECWRLQGFPDWAFDKASKVNSNSQLYKQAGNSVTVPVIAAIANKLAQGDNQQ